MNPKRNAALPPISVVIVGCRNICPGNVVADAQTSAIVTNM
jgi:hypothetical protein